MFSPSIQNRVMKIDDQQFAAALAAAFLLTDEQLRDDAKSGTSRSYFVVFDGRTFPLKAVLRLAYKNEDIKWDGPQSSKAARQLRPHFQILHITTDTETKRLDRQRKAVERWQRDGRFRAKVLDLFGSTCVVSDCVALDAIDAAHLLGVNEKGDDKPENGIVLRADLHRLFDAEPAQMAICPKDMTVHFAKGCRDHYVQYVGRVIQLPKGGPKADAFRAHWKRYKQAQKGQ